MNRGDRDEMGTLRRCETESYKKTFFQERDHMPGFRNIIGVCYQELQTSKKKLAGEQRKMTHTFLKI